MTGSVPVLELLGLRDRLRSGPRVTRCECGDCVSLSCPGSLREEGLKPEVSPEERTCRAVHDPGRFYLSDSDKAMADSAALNWKFGMMGYRIRHQLVFSGVLLKYKLFQTF